MNGNNNVKVVFYEWSNLNGTPLGFTSNDEFVNFCNASNIKMNKKVYNFLENNPYVYATCKRGKAELVLSGDYKNLRKNYSKHRND